MSFAALIDQGWDDHADRPEAVADRLAASLHLVQRADDVLPFASLLTHVYGVHLGRWSDGVVLLRSLRDSAGGGAVEPRRVIERHVAALRHSAGDVDAFEALDANPVDDRICALSIAVSALAGKGEFTRAQASLAEALRLADGGLATGSPAVRALAVAGNNLAAALEEQPARSDGDTRSMIAAAECGLTYWRRAGTWREEALALVRVACSCQQAGNPARALQSALAALAVCDANAASADARAEAESAVASARRALADVDADADADAKKRVLLT